MSEAAAASRLVVLALFVLATGAATAAILYYTLPA